jgi:hypothetical protein
VDGESKIDKQARKYPLTWWFIQIQRVSVTVGLTGFEPATP